VALVVGLWAASLAALVPTAAALASAAASDGGGTVAVGALSAEALSLASVAVGTVVFSDAFSGLFHWATDNYGNKDTPVFGGVIDAFQGHHGNPWTITHRSFCNNVHKIARAALPLLGLCCAVSAAPAWRLFAVLFLNAQVLSQEFHKLAHEPRPPQWAVALQKSNLAISKKVPPPLSPLPSPLSPLPSPSRSLV
jgi:ubiquitin-conjugating enzyme E2 variant